MAQLDLTRRQLVKALLLLGVGGMTVRYWRMHAQDESKLSRSVLSVDDPSNPSFEVFAALSAMVTLRDDLDPIAATRMYKVFMDEPWGPEHMSGAYSKLRQRLDGAAAVEKLTQGESWFISHLLTTWYLGIYYHEKRPTQRIVYEKALMFEAVKDWLPIPFLEATGPRNWQKPPEKKT